MMASSGDFACTFSCCERRFKRQEHLTRHERSHDPAHLFVCQVCQKEFNRKDSLHRHLTLHADVLLPALPRKTKRACVACRRGKNKCDGEARCSACVRRDVECRYQDLEDDVQMGGMTDGVSSAELRLLKEKERHLNKGGGTNHPRTVAAAASQTSRTSLPKISSDEEAPPRLPAIPESLGKGKIIDWMSVQIRQDPVTPASVTSTEIATEEERVTLELYTQEYFKSFHHRWTLINRPTYEMEGPETLLAVSVQMMGAWLVGTVESRKFAWEVHEKCMVEMMPKLHRITCQDNLWETFSASLCHAVVLNIIFGLYTGDREEISRCFILLKTLVAALREIALFDEETAWPDEKPGFFLPMRMGAVGQRQRLATYLFKIDTYLSILRNQPPSINPEDLHFPLPTTFAAYNSNGLHIWEERHNAEPTYRNHTTIFRMITEQLSDCHSKESTPMLIEDIQICMCAAWSSIWRMTRIEARLQTTTPSITSEKAALQQQLDALKSRLDLIYLQLSNTNTLPYPQETPYLPPQYYFGHEDPSLPSSPSLVSDRMRDLLTDTQMLYHLLTITLSFPLATLVHLAKDLHPTPTEEASEIHTQARANRILLAKIWGLTPGARRSLCHSVDILTAAQSLTSNPDPISHIALTFASIVVYAFSVYGGCACIGCVPNPLVPFVEMSKWSQVGCEMERREREAWIEVGVEFRPKMQGIQMCGCHSGFLVSFFKGYLPAGWEVGGLVPDLRPCV